MNCISTIHPSLEQEYANEAFCKVDIRKTTFSNFLRPNEKLPEAIQSHLLKLQERGIFVSTGTERSFFDVIFANEQICEGLVIRDINPPVKAYVDFNILLIRIANTFEEYRTLSYIEEEAYSQETIQERIKIIREKTEQTDLEERIKSYYLEHLEDFATVYFSTQDPAYLNWREDSYYDECNYYKPIKQNQFLKIQKYARAGNIISTMGEIGDLKFLKNRKITLIDTSNISDYVVLKLKGEGDFNPLIIWTELDRLCTHYHSCHIQSLNDQEQKEFEELLKIFNELGELTDKEDEHFGDVLKGQLIKYSSADTELLEAISYSKQTLHLLNKFIDNNVIIDKTLGRFSFHSYGNNFHPFKKINNLSLDEVKKLSQHPNIKNFSRQLVFAWEQLTLSHYLAFMEIEGWKEAFEKTFSCHTNLTQFLDRLEEANLLNLFTIQFGADRLEALKTKLSSSTVS